MNLSGRVNAVEDAITFLLQDFLRVPSIQTLSDLSQSWNQQFDITESKIQLLEIQLNKLQALYVNLALDVSSGSTSGSYLPISFETYNKSLHEYPYSLHYSGEVLTGISYALNSDYIQKSLYYNSSGLIDHITISSSSPLNVTLNKYFLYSGETLTGVYYS